LHVRISHTTFSRCVNHSPRRPSNERRVPETEVIKRYPRDCLVFNVFPYRIPLRNSISEATARELFALLTWTALNRHGWIKKKARLDAKPSRVQKCTVDFAVNR